MQQYKYSITTAYTAEGYRISSHVYGNTVEETVAAMSDLQTKALDEANRKRWKLAPFKEPRTAVTK